MCNFYNPNKYIDNYRITVTVSLLYYHCMAIIA